MTDLVLARRALPGSREEGRRCDFVFFGLERGFFGDRDPDAEGTRSCPRPCRASRACDVTWPVTGDGDPASCCWSFAQNEKSLFGPSLTSCAEFSFDLFGPLTGCVV